MEGGRPRPAARRAAARWGVAALGRRLQLRTRGGAEARLEAWSATDGDGIFGEWSRAELEEHVRDEHSTFTWLLEPIIRRAGFDIDDALYSADGVFARYVLRAV